MKKLTQKQKDFLIILFDHRTQFPDGLTLSETKELTNIAFKTPEIIGLANRGYITYKHEPVAGKLTFTSRYKLIDGIDKQLLAILLSK